ncbi:MAG: ArsR family transcriptional regulator [Pseudomonadales bacterium]|nr:ArsR family transcriptional regulator [Pseudomonadales bacterium]NRA14880.1 helix-turn-helix transcriptional regulator [Oceanospirillaceae bacterium]
MTAIHRMAKMAGAMASPARLKMLEFLADGVARSATDLAILADVQANTATTHLQVLLKVDLIKVKKQGRYRFFQIRDEVVGDMLEVLGEQVAYLSHTQIPPQTEIAFARSCYDHIAGWLGVNITHSLIVNRYLEEQTNGNYSLTANGETFFSDLGVDLHKVKKSRRQFARACCDWTENKNHLGGALGAALMGSLQNRQWIRKNPDYREIFITKKGKQGLADYFDLNL